MRVNFYKYASNGNNFILIDEIVNEEVSEINKAILAKTIEGNTSGIGCDSVLYLQRWDKKVVDNIYSKKVNIKYDHNSKPDYIMRIFEKGSESNMCGNGLICLGHHLAIKHGVHNAKIATEIPTLSPVIRHVSYVQEDMINAILGETAIPPISFVNQSAVFLIKNQKYFHLLEFPLTIHLDGKNHSFFITNAYITFTGEPHLVIFRQVNSNKIIDKVFDLNESSHISASVIEQIGLQLNRSLKYFPKGINVNFADIISEKTIINRCFERGINAETYACGTGAVAVSFLANELNLLSAEKVNVLPLKAMQDDWYKNAVLEISITNKKYCISAKSILLAEGTYYFPKRLLRPNVMFNAA